MIGLEIIKKYNRTEVTIFLKLKLVGGFQKLKTSLSACGNPITIQKNKYSSIKCSTGF